MVLSVDIRKKLGDFLLDIQFTVEDGVFALLGASGCGKSMTLKCIAGIETPDSGKIILDDQVLFDSSRKINLPPQKRKVGYMFQDYALFPNMTVEQNIGIGMGKRPNQNIIKSYIDKFHLQGLEKQYPSQLSGGQKQRTAMARMLASQPNLILLDEPFSALDSYLKWKLERQTKEILKEAGKPAVFVSHNRDEVYRLCDMVGCVDQGKLVVKEPVREFFLNPKTKEAALLSGCKNVSDIQVLDEHHIRATGWNVTLYCEMIPADTKAIGIRAHYFEPITNESESAENRFPVCDYHILEDPFEWNIAFCTESGSEEIQWKVSKKEYDFTCMPVPEYLTVAEKDILFLR